METYVLKRKEPLFVWVTAVVLIFAVGLRIDVGADYPIYRDLFSGFSLYASYGDVFDKALFRETKEEIEWLFVLINKLVFDFGQPFYWVTFIMALIAIPLKFNSIYKDSAIPTLSMLFYFMPIMFFEDSGQMRQGIAIAICVFSFRFIKSRNLLLYLLCIYIGIGFHKTAIIFLPAYWIVKIPMNSKRIIWVLVVSLLLSPLELYKLAGGFFDSISPAEISSAYTGYMQDEYYGQEVQSGLNDIVKVIWIVILVRYDKKGCDNILWYEYMRNLAVFGLAMFYFFRSNQIFAVRLPGAYMFFITMYCFPNLVYANKDKVKQSLYTLFMTYLTMMFFYFGNGNGHKGRFGMKHYKNVLLGDRNVYE